MLSAKPGATGSSVWTPVSPPGSCRAASCRGCSPLARARLVPTNAKVGADAHVVVELSNAQSGAPVTDVEPYLGAWGHMLLSSADQSDIVHSHPLIEETDAGGPRITFQTLFAREGWYRIWAQVQRRGRLLTFGFTVRVAPSL